MKSIDCNIRSSAYEYSIRVILKNRTVVPLFLLFVSKITDNYSINDYNKLIKIIGEL